MIRLISSPSDTNHCANCEDLISVQIYETGYVDKTFGILDWWRPHGDVLQIEPFKQARTPLAYRHRTLHWKLPPRLQSSYSKRSWLKTWQNLLFLNTRQEKAATSTYHTHRTKRPCSVFSKFLLIFIQRSHFSSLVLICDKFSLKITTESFFIPSC